MTHYTLINGLFESGMSTDTSLGSKIEFQPDWRSRALDKTQLVLTNTNNRREHLTLMSFDRPSCHKCAPVSLLRLEAVSWSRTEQIDTPWIR
jgi:hypothetical protein